MRKIAGAYARFILQWSTSLFAVLRSNITGPLARPEATSSTLSALFRDSPALLGAAALLAYLLLGLDWGAGAAIWHYTTLSLGMLLAIPPAARVARGVWHAWADPRPVSTAALYGLGAAAAGIAAIGVLRLLGLVPQLVIPIHGTLTFQGVLTAIDPDLLILAGATGLGALIGGRYGDPQRRALGLFCGCAAGFVITANAYFLGVADYTVLMTPDSPGYLYRNACRTPGYLVLLTPLKLADPRWLVALQLNLVLASQVATAAAVLRLTSSVAAGIVVLVVATLLCHLNSLAFFVLTEPVFAAALGFAAAAAIAYLRAPSTWLAAALGLAIAAALAVKAVAPALVLVVPFLLLRAASARHIKALAMLGPPIVCLVGLSAVGRVANGAWSPTNFGGYALAENLAWGIRNDSYSTDPDLSAAIEESLRSFTGDWPSPLDANAYLATSIDNLDIMFWKTMVPVVARRHGLGEGAPHCPREVNAALTTLGTDAIRRFPFAYAGHVAVQFYGLWGQVLVPQTWDKQARRLRRDIAQAMTTWSWRAAPPRWRPTEERLAAVRAGAGTYDARPLFLDRVKLLVGAFGATVGAAPTVLPRARPPVPDIDPGTAKDDEIAAREMALSVPDFMRICPYLGMVFAALTLAFAALSPRIARLKPEVAALALLGLLINAYFASHALFMFALPRYAACIEAPLAAFIAILGYAAVRAIGVPALGRLAGALRSRSGPMTWSRG